MPNRISWRRAKLYQGGVQHVAAYLDAQARLHEHGRRRSQHLHLLGGGTKEARRAVWRPRGSLGLPASNAEIDRLFDSWDPDRSGEISLQELNKQLRRGGEIKLDKKMLAGGAGEIVLESRNARALRS